MASRFSEHEPLSIIVGGECQLSKTILQNIRHCQRISENTMFRKWCEVTSCNGVVDVLESKQSGNTVKFMFWIIVVITMVTATCWFTFRTIQCYIETPIVTNVAMVFEGTMPLPQVLVCYNGGLNVEAMKLAGLSNNLIYDLPSTLAAYVYKWNTSAAELNEYMSKQNLRIKDVLEKFGYGCSDFVSLLVLPTFSPNLACINVTTVYSDQGKCYVFSQNGRQEWPGIGGGITMELRRPLNSYYELNSDRANEIMMNDGFSMSFEKTIGQQKSSNTVLIPLNAKVEIVLNVKRFVRLGNGKTCDSSPTMYTSNTCYWACYLKEMIRHCNCGSITYWNDALSAYGYEMCDPFFEINNCTDLFMYYDRVRACQALCKPICDEWIYETSVSYILQQNARYRLNKSNVAVAYTTMQYTKVILLCP